MCGIAGYTGPEQPGILERMAAAVAHRGPDGQGSWHDSTRSVHLAHRRLAIVDRAGGAQPMRAVDDGLVVTYNGEIYNAAELRAELTARGRHFVSTHSDTEVLLEGYREWGDELPAKLNGMWAFVIHDRARHRLFASVDRFGEKPLYYADLAGGLLFGSELGALRAHPLCPTGLDRPALRKYFAYGFIPAPRTMLSHVQRLPGGCSFSYELGAGRFTVRRYWQFALEPSEPAAARTEDDLADELLALLRQAVRRRLLADVELGVLLSGGIDSSAVAALATAEKGRSRVASFTLGFADPSFDESQPAKQVATHLGTVHRATRLEPGEAGQILETLWQRGNEPLGDPSLVPTAALSRFARQHVGVVLGGDGGDELFAGYDTFRALRYARTYTALTPRPVHQAIAWCAGRLAVSHRNLSFDFKVKRFLRGAGQAPRLWHPLWLAPLDPREWQELFEEPMDLEEVFSEAIAAWESVSSGGVVDRSLQFFTRLYLPDNILRKLDGASMLQGLEARSPFLDIDVVDFARRLPARYKLRGGCTKYLLKRAMRGLLPAETIQRPKKGFGLPVGAWLKSGALSLDSIGDIPGMRRDRLRAAADEHRAGVRDHRQLLWGAKMLSTWLNPPRA